MFTNFLCRNTSIIQEKTSSHVLQLTDSSAEELVIELEEIFDSIIDGFVRIGNCSVDLLVSKIIETLQVSLFDSLFTNSWLTDSECTTMQSVAVTLHDYFEDYLCGISAQFYLSSLVSIIPVFADFLSLTL